jgi:hypothetical protein
VPSQPHLPAGDCGGSCAARRLPPLVVVTGGGGLVGGLTVERVGRGQVFHGVVVDRRYVGDKEAPLAVRGSFSFSSSTGTGGRVIAGIVVEQPVFFLARDDEYADAKEVRRGAELSR